MPTHRVAAVMAREQRVESDSVDGITFFATSAPALLIAAIMNAATLLMKSQASPDLINLVLFGYTLTFFPTLALTNTLAMKNMTNPEKEFPGIRVFGTIGWIVIGLVGFHCACAPNATSAPSVNTAAFKIRFLMTLPPLGVSLPQVA